MNEITNNQFDALLATSVERKTLVKDVPKSSKKNQKNKKQGRKMLIPTLANRSVSINNHKVNVYSNYLNVKYLSIVCDWFEISGTTDEFFLIGVDIDSKEKSQQIFDISADLVIHYMGVPKNAFKRRFQVYSEGNLTGEVFCVPKFPKTMKANLVNFKIANNLLYTKGWTEVYSNVVKRLNIVPNNISRLDIAIDGCNGLIDFVTRYTKQYGTDVDEITRVNTAQLNPQYFQDSTFSYKGFTLGSRQSDKYLVCYEKSKELLSSGKKYIKEYWINAGFTNTENVERVEIRFNSKYLKTISFTLSKCEILEDPNQLARIFKNGIEKFLDFRFKTSLNLTYCDRIELIPFDRFNFNPLIRCKPTLMDGLFRVKMSVKHAVEQLLKGYQDKKDVNIAFIKESLDLYSLHEWYEKRLPEWQKIFKTNQTTEHIYELEQL